MEYFTIDRIYNEIMLLSNDDKQILYDRMQKEFHKKNEIIAFSTQGKPLTQKQYIEKIEKAIAEADRGELITNDELQKEIETW